MSDEPDLADVPDRRLINALRERGLIVVVWAPDDVATLRPEWDEARCADELDKAKRYFTDRSIELGWEVLEDLLPLTEGV